MSVIACMLTQHWEQPIKTALGTNNDRLNFIQDDHSKKGKGQLRKQNLLLGLTLLRRYQHHIEEGKPKYTLHWGNHRYVLQY